MLSLLPHRPLPLPLVRLPHSLATVVVPSKELPSLSPATLPPPSLREGRSVPGLPKLYSGLMKWPALPAMVEHLVESIVYHRPGARDGLVVLSKPWGLPTHPSPDSSLSLACCLPSLASALSLPSLSLCGLTPERFTSGLTVLAASPEQAEALRRGRALLKGRRQLGDAYLCLCKGHSRLAGEPEVVQLRQEEVPGVAKPLIGSRHKEPVIERQLLKSKFKARLYRRPLGRVRAQSLANGSLAPASLVKVEPSITKHHFTSVYLADLGHPLLGDQLYDYRCRGLMGHPVRQGPQQSQAQRSQVLPLPIRERLGLGQGEEWRLPKLSHLFRVLLPRVCEGGGDLTVFAPPPPHFSLTAEALGVELSFKELAESDAVTVYEPREKEAKGDKHVDEHQEVGDGDESVGVLAPGGDDKMLTLNPKVHRPKSRIFRPNTLGRT